MMKYLMRFKWYKTYYQNRYLKDICICGHPLSSHRLLGKIQSCEYGLDSEFSDACCPCIEFIQIKLK